jgi:hypothetical protein
MFCNNTINAVIHTALSIVKIINNTMILNLKLNHRQTAYIFIDTRRQK